jgi:hypothetical protein
MSIRWISARHCYHALKILLARLNVSPGPEISSDLSDPDPGNHQTGHLDSSGHDVAVPAEASTAKRRRVQNDAEMDEAVLRPPGTGSNDHHRGDTTWTHWAPVLQYNGPDFGFDAFQLGFQQQEDQAIGDFGFGSTGLFNDMGWNGFSHEFNGI